MSSIAFRPLQVGVTHVQDWDPWSAHQDSVQRAVGLMRDGMLTYQNQGVIVGGGMWLPSPQRPNTTFGHDWSHLDCRVQAMRNASSVPGRMVGGLLPADPLLDPIPRRTIVLPLARAEGSSIQPPPPANQQHCGPGRSPIMPLQHSTVMHGGPPPVFFRRHSGCSMRPVGCATGQIRGTRQATHPCAVT